MRRALVIIAVVAAVAVIVAQRDRLGIGVGYVKARLMPKARVADRLRSYENGARERLEPALRAKGVSYPLKSFTLLTIKDASVCSCSHTTATGARCTSRPTLCLRSRARLALNCAKATDRFRKGLTK